LESSTKKHTSQFLQVERLELARQVAACAGILEDDFQETTYRGTMSTKITALPWMTKPENKVGLTLQFRS